MWIREENLSPLVRFLSLSIGIDYDDDKLVLFLETLRAQGSAQWTSTPAGALAIAATMEPGDSVAEVLVEAPQLDPPFIQAILESQQLFSWSDSRLL